MTALAPSSAAALARASGAGAAALGAPTPLRRGMITLSIMLATIMQTLDTTIANVALPHMQGSLSASQDQIIWVLTSYIVAAAIATPLTGWLSDRFGRRRLLLWSVAGFTIASALCGLSDSLVQIVVARLLQGLCGASLVPLSQATLLDINPRERQGQAMAVWGMGVMVGPILGPTLGGWLTENYDWTWVFFINVPIGVIAYLGIARYMPERKSAHLARFDLFGFAMLGLSIGLLQMLLDRGELLDWWSSTEIRVEAIGAFVCFAFFIAHTATAQGASFFETRILRDRNYVAGVVVIFVIGLVMYATRALLPPMLQDLMHFPVLATGFDMAPSGAGTMLSMLIAGRLVGRVDLRAMMIAGVLLTAYSLYQMTHYTLVLSEADIIWPGVVQGFGLGLVFVPLASSTFATLKSELRAAGTAIYSLSRNIGSSIGISIVQTLYTRTSEATHARLAENISALNPLTNGYDLSSPVVLAGLNAQVSDQARMIAYIGDFRIMMIMTLAILPLIFLIRIAPRRPDEPIHAAAAVD